MSPKDPKEVEEFKEGLFEAREDKFKFLLKCYRDLFCCSCFNLHAIGVAVHPALLNLKKILNILVKKLVPVAYISLVQIFI